MGFFKKARNTACNVLDVADASINGLLMEIRKEQLRDRINDAKFYKKMISKAEKITELQGDDAINKVAELHNDLLDLMDKML